MSFVSNGLQDVYCACPSITAAFEAFDPATGQTAVLPPAPTPRYRHTAVAVGGDIMLIGGWRLLDCTIEACDYPGQEVLVTQVDAYDVERATWRTLRQPFPGGGDLGSFVLGTTIYAVGGYDIDYNALATTHKLDMADASDSPWGLATADALATSRGEREQHRCLLPAPSGANRKSVPRGAPMQHLAPRRNQRS